ncbi:YcgL domain-containing protein [Motiliproteus coralliicola]|uniref:YcgL domain-containing protein DV711_08715 n=1 Tax=Motiliproteus coralliicola TaxID=2283196 RepID=A0A369WPV9_9GAMM|nr:YcgL domain-containing protein [Motiliproteus coralliicola]RDE22654.1 YcgL domain-containing protein [Motiliproteus coralliicola]
MKVICSVYKSPKKPDMYLYVDKKEGLARVPEALLEMFGKPQEAMTLLVTPGKKLARVEAPKLLSALRDPGYYLQMPPPKEEYMLDLYRAPTEAKY